MFLTTSGYTLRTVPPALRGVFETNTPHMELDNAFSAAGETRGPERTLPIGRGILRRRSRPSGGG